MSDNLTSLDVAEVVFTTDFAKEIESVINKYSIESMNNTPDFILAQYLEKCLEAYSIAVNRRDKWFNVDMWNKNNTQ